MNECMNECNERKEKTELGRMLHSIKLTKSLKFFCFCIFQVKKQIYKYVHIHIYTGVCVCVFIHPSLSATHTHTQTTYLASNFGDLNIPNYSL